MQQIAGCAQRAKSSGALCGVLRVGFCGFHAVDLGINGILFPHGVNSGFYCKSDSVAADACVCGCRGGVCSAACCGSRCDIACYRA